MTKRRARKERKYRLNENEMKKAGEDSGLSKQDFAKRIGYSYKSLLDRYVKTGTVLEEVEQIASLINREFGTDYTCHQLICPEDRPLEAYALDFDAIVKVESKITAGGGICIVASQPFIETKSNALLKQVKLRLKDKVNITYYYTLSNPAEVQRPTVTNPMLSSVNSIRNNIYKIAPKSVCAYFFHNYRAQLVTDTTILVIFFSDKKEKFPSHIFQYTPCSDLYGTSGGELWLRLHEGENGQFYKSVITRLCDHSEPVSWLGLYENVCRQIK